MHARIATMLLVAAGFAAAQGKPTIAEQLRGGTANQQLRDELGIKGNAGAGYIQQGFLESLETSLKETVGEKRAAELLQNLKGADLTSKEVTDLLNGKMTESQLANLCKAGKGETEALEEAVDEAVDEKDRKCFFGILIIVVICDCKCEDGDFLKQMFQGIESMEPDSAERLMKGDVSTKTIGESFGFSDKDMCKQMQDALNQLRSSPFVNHPMCESMGLGAAGKFDPAAFPKPLEGMPGCGGEFPGGEAGGLPFDTELPPLPFAGENIGCCCGEKPAEGGAAPAGGGEKPAQ